MFKDPASAQSFLATQLSFHIPISRAHILQEGLNSQALISQPFLMLVVTTWSSLCQQDVRVTGLLCKVSPPWEVYRGMSGESLYWDALSLTFQPLNTLAGGWDVWNSQRPYSNWKVNDKTNRQRQEEGRERHDYYWLTTPRSAYPYTSC